MTDVSLGLGPMNDLALPAFGMWAAMMAAMMVPSVMPTLRVFALASPGPAPAATAATAVVAGGYLVVWLGFSAAAAVLQMQLETSGWLSPATGRLGVFPSAIVLAAAGLYQWSPGKDVCLRHCRSPQSYILTHWRPGLGPALAFGVRHGLYCLGCCVFLMALFFVVGVMSLWWMAALAALILAEKWLPFGETLAKVGGALMVAGALGLAILGG